MIIHGILAHGQQQQQQQQQQMAYHEPSSRTLRKNLLGANSNMFPICLQ